MKISTELLNNGSFDSGSIDFMTNWFIPTNWESSWNDRFYGTLKLESVGAVYNASNALLLSYTPSDDELNYDTVYRDTLPPGVCQIIDLRKQNLSNVSHFTFSMNARLNLDASLCKVDVIFYKATSDNTSYSFDAPFEEYEVLASIDIKKSPVWNHITFDIDATYLPKGVYKMYIAPHINITDIQYENIIESTNVIIDDVSFSMVEQIDDGTDLDDTGIIKNGSFSIWVDGMPKYWDLMNMDVLTTDEDGDTVYEDHTFTISPTNEYERNSSLKFDWGEPGYGYYVNKSKIMPGLYQLLDLSEYEYGAEITIGYSIRRDTNGYSYTSYRHGVDLYVYKASYIESTGEYVPTGGLFDYLYTRNPRMEDEWATYTDTFSLNKGYYLIGFTPELKYGTVSGVERPRTGDFHAIIDDIYGEIEAKEPEITYGEIIFNGSFESQIDNWTYEEKAIEATIRKDYTDRTFKYPAYRLGDYYCNLYYKSGILEEDKEHFHYGLKQHVLSKVNADAFFSFWHYTASKIPLTFKVCIYETRYHLHDDTYQLVEPAMFEETITTSNAGWNNYANIISLKYNTYYTVVFYPSNDSEAAAHGICLDNVSLASFGERVLSQYGSFENPLTTSDGFLKCNTKTDGSYSYSFYPYDPYLPDGEYFIKLYLIMRGIDYICTNGKRDKSGFLLHYANEMVQSPGNLEGMRYFFEDGHMAINTTFIYNGKSYIADETGALREYVLDIDYINLSPDISPIIINTDQTKTITLTFNEQEVPCTLSVEISNTAIATVTGITKGNSSNEVNILGKNMGKTTLRAWIINPDGTVIEKIFKIEVRDELPEEYKGAKIYIPYKENSMKFSSSVYPTLQVSYYILPEYLSSMPIEWTSSNENVAVVDMSGLILAKSIGECTITAKNPYSGESVSFKLYVCAIFEYALKIELSENDVSLAIGQTRHITTRTLNTDGSTKHVSQDVKWESMDTNVATVNKYGYITAVGRGTTDIVCKSVKHSVSNAIRVVVTGSKIELQDIELDCYSIDFNSPYKGKSVKIRCRPVPSNATDSDVIWASSDESLVRVTQGGYVYSPLEGGIWAPAYITCTSKSRPDIVKVCEINFSHYAKGDGMIVTAFDTDLNTCIGRTLRIDYDYFINHKSSYVPNCDVSVTKTLDVIMQTPTTVTLEEDSYGKYINFVATEVGTYYVELKLAYDDNHSKTMSKIFTVHVYGADAAPVLKNDLTVLYALQNDSCILRCRMEDQVDELRDVNFFIDFNDGVGYEAISAYFEPSSANIYQYFFISGYQLTPGTEYQVKIKAIDSQGFETTTNATSLTIPLIKNNNHKEQLGNAKKDYDSAIAEVLDILNWLIVPNENIMPASRKADFFVYYRIFCYNYENLRDMLDQCIKIINSRIGTSQAEIASFSNTLSSGGVSIASYSEGDYTNSNYQNITDMDYYQNECIKQLVARVLELEARLDELTNNNN